MNEENFLKLSYLLHDLPLKNKLNLHIIRYKYFYKNSLKGHNCTYAKMTRNAFLKENEKEMVLAQLRTIPDTEKIIVMLEEL